MSLNWNIENVKDREQIQTDDEWLITDSLIWATMAVGFTEITEANYEEFYKRLHLAELVRGAYRNRAGEPVYITKEDVKRRIGLHTNAGTFSRTEFLRRINKSYFAEQ